MKTTVALMVATCVCHAAVVAFPLADPGRLLRVPRIYNALIRSDAKLQPSRAFPYSTPVFQPIGLGPVPGIDRYQPEPYPLQEQPSMLESPTTATKDENIETKPKSENTKMTQPLTFYPRSFGYYQTQPIIPYGYPFGPQPYVFGSPYDFGHQALFRYPSPSLAGYHGGLYEQAGGVYDAGNVEPAMKSNAVKSSFDSVGVRESEFYDDEEQVSEVRKDSDEAETS